MRRRDVGVPGWGVVSSVAAPVLLIGGWTLAARRQHGGFDPVVDTISALAARDADDRWVMTTALAGLGVCHLVTALALRPARLPGRLVLGVGGVATVLVAAFPLPSGGGSSQAHSTVAGIAFLCLGLWPLASWRVSAPGLLRRAHALAAGVVLLGLVGWFFAELTSDSARVGLAERVAAGAQALWPLAVVASVIALARRARR